VDAFSYLSILLSIIIGLGLTQILTALGRIIRHRDRVRVDWLLLIRRRGYQELVGVVSAAAFVAYVALLFTRLG